MTFEEIDRRLVLEKACPSKYGLEDYYGRECDEGSIATDCDECRQMSIKVAKGEVPKPR